MLVKSTFQLYLTPFLAKKLVHSWAYSTQKNLSIDYILTHFKYSKKNHPFVVGYTITWGVTDMIMKIAFIKYHQIVYCSFIKFRYDHILK